MADSNGHKIFNHQKASISDRISIISEMEHLRRHAIRSAIVADSEDKEGDAFEFLVWAKALQDMRREYMQTHFAKIDNKYWCMCKSAACLRQLAYEVDGGDKDFLREVDNLVDDIWGTALGEDLSDCEACKSDRGE